MKTVVSLQEIAKSRSVGELTAPELARTHFAPPVTIKILMVTDDGGSFGNADFGLAELISALVSTPRPYMRISVKTANRTKDSTADIENLRFDSVLLNGFDQIWLFGVERDTYTLSDQELIAICKYMDTGGGVFATGDHENLGQALSAKIPRVRSMRAWHYPDAGPDGERVGPPVNSSVRYDTVVRRGIDKIVKQNQSDDIPQVISPKIYSVELAPDEHIEIVHPVLCTADSAITVMPDHAHEGECYEPEDLTLTLNIGGQLFIEYPKTSDNYQPSPEVIAQSSCGYRRVNDFKGPLNPQTFGSICVYDGHQADVGRVLVDSTWHHFFNINLVGENNSSDPVFSQGFLASEAGVKQYAIIKEYFRNIAAYLAPKAFQSKMFVIALHWTRWHHSVAMQLKPEVMKAEQESFLPEYSRLGKIALEVLTQISSSSQVFAWTVGALPNPLITKHLNLLSREKIEFPFGSEKLLQYLVQVIIGKNIYLIARKFPTFASSDGLKLQIEPLMEEIQNESLTTVTVALAEYADMQTLSVQKLSEIITTLQKHAPKPKTRDRDSE